ncbi:MAG: FAD:protein FMN transferase [Planctomycetes bacterium]|nr:FAD:protein FMN transferase [Planctomycetota bacterium]
MDEISSDESDTIAPLLETYSLPGDRLQADFVRFEVDAVGTRNVFLVRGCDKPRLQRAAHEAMLMLDRFEQKLSKFLPESELSLVNQLAFAHPVVVGEDLFELLLRSQLAWRATDGAFDPSVAPLLDAWGFVDGAESIPSDDDIARMLEARGMDLVVLDVEKSTVGFLRPGVALDLGGIAKGYIADCVAEHFQAHGATAGAVVCGRSTVVTWGTPPNEDAWRFQVVDPLNPTSSYAHAIAEPGAVSSSGAYERTVRHGATDYGHVFDPRQGRPARSTVQGVTVWTESAFLGDVLSTTLFLLGCEALAPGGAAERLLQAWFGGEEQRFAALVLENDSATPNQLNATFHAVGGLPLRIEG